MTTLSLLGARWAVQPADADRVAGIAARTGMSAAAARCLALRFDGEDLSARERLNPSIDHLHDPLRMRNMDAALDRLDRALARGEKVRVVTDYDVDGTTSSLILQAALKLRRPDLDVSYHIPNRFDEGTASRCTRREPRRPTGSGCWSPPTSASVTTRRSRLPASEAWTS